jgi:hypothetical protein
MINTSIYVTSSNATSPFESGVRLYLRKANGETGILVVKYGKVVQGIYIRSEDVPKLIEELKKLRC